MLLCVHLNRYLVDKLSHLYPHSDAIITQLLLSMISTWIVTCPSRTAGDLEPITGHLAWSTWKAARHRRLVPVTSLMLGCHTSRMGVYRPIRSLVSSGIIQS